MIGITISPEQLATAPPEVRRWVENEIATTLGAVAKASHSLAQTEVGGIAPCTPEEALRIFDLLKGDYFACQVFFEFGHGSGAAQTAHPLYGFNVGEILRHTRLGSSEHLIACLEAINAALRQVRNDASATLFALDQHGNVYVHAVTHQSIHRLWCDLAGIQSGGATGAGAAAPSHGAAPPFDPHYVVRRADDEERAVTPAPSAAPLDA